MSSGSIYLYIGIKTKQNKTKHQQKKNRKKINQLMMK